MVPAALAASISAASAHCGSKWTHHFLRGQSFIAAIWRVSFARKGWVSGTIGEGSSQACAGSITTLRSRPERGSYHDERALSRNRNAESWVAMWKGGSTTESEAS